MSADSQDALQLLERARQILESSDNKNLRASAQLLRESIQWVQRAQQQCDNGSTREPNVQRPILNTSKE